DLRNEFQQWAITIEEEIARLKNELKTAKNVYFGAKKRFRERKKSILSLAEIKFNNSQSNVSRLNQKLARKNQELQEIEKQNKRISQDKESIGEQLVKAQEIIKAKEIEIIELQNSLNQEQIAHNRTFEELANTTEGFQILAEKKDNLQEQHQQDIAQKQQKITELNSEIYA
ncbi:638_t:CDS:1, partial [Entrophospora sp. SA101]